MRKGKMYTKDIERNCRDRCVHLDILILWQLVKLVNQFVGNAKHCVAVDLHVTFSKHGCDSRSVRAPLFVGVESWRTEKEGRMSVLLYPCICMHALPRRPWGATTLMPVQPRLEKCSLSLRIRSPMDSFPTTITFLIAARRRTIGPNFFTRSWNSRWLSPVRPKGMSPKYLPKRVSVLGSNGILRIDSYPGGTIGAKKSWETHAS